MILTYFDLSYTLELYFIIAGTAKIQIVVASPPVEVYMKMDETLITTPIEMNLKDVKQIFVQCIATGKETNFHYFSTKSKIFSTGWHEMNGPPFILKSSMRGGPFISCHPVWSSGKLKIFQKIIHPNT